MWANSPYYFLSWKMIYKQKFYSMFLDVSAVNNQDYFERFLSEKTQLAFCKHREYVKFSISY